MRATKCPFQKRRHPPFHLCWEIPTREIRLGKFPFLPGRLRHPYKNGFALFLPKIRRIGLGEIFKRACNTPAFCRHIFVCGKRGQNAPPCNLSHGLPSNPAPGGKGSSRQTGIPMRPARFRQAQESGEGKPRPITQCARPGRLSQTATSRRRAQRGRRTNRGRARQALW